MDPFPGVNRKGLAAARAEKSVQAGARGQAHAKAVLARRELHFSRLTAKHAAISARQNAPKPPAL